MSKRFWRVYNQSCVRFVCDVLSCRTVQNLSGKTQPQKRQCASTKNVVQRPNKCAELEDGNAVENPVYITIVDYQN